MNKLLKNLCAIGIAMVIALSASTVTFAGGGGTPPPPIIPKPPTTQGSGG